MSPPTLPIKQIFLALVADRLLITGVTSLAAAAAGDAAGSKLSVLFQLRLFSYCCSLISGYFQLYFSDRILAISQLSLQLMHVIKIV